MVLYSLNVLLILDDSWEPLLIVRIIAFALPTKLTAFSYRRGHYKIGQSVITAEIPKIVGLITGTVVAKQ